MSVVVGHSMFALGFAWPERYMDWYAALDAHPWMLALVNLSEPAMDTFLILTGFLAAHSLGPAFQSGKRPSQIVRSYMKRRLLRIVPSYYATLVLVYCAFLPLLYSGATSGVPSEARQAISTLWFNPGDGCPDKLWANWIFANNQIRRAGCMKYAWSQAVQAQFYLGFPLLLLLLRPAVRGLFRRMALLSSLVIAAVTAYRAAIALQFELPVPVFGPLDDPRMLELMTRTLRLSYYSLLPRLSHLSFGVLGACSLRSSAVRAALTKRRGVSNCGVAAAAVFMAALLFGNRFGPAPDAAHPLSSPAALVSGVALVTGLLQPAALTYIIVHLALKISGTLSGCLSWRGWRLIADASYDIYLLHPIVMFGVWSVLLPGDWFDMSKPRLLPFLAVTSIVFGISFVLAAAHSRAWRWILRRFGLTT
ncbi:g2238 [Coccomyxa elongata]